MNPTDPDPSTPDDVDAQVPANETAPPDFIDDSDGLRFVDDANAISSHDEAPVPPALDPAVLRLIDANANRAREALRVLEDYTRFVLDERGRSADLKDVRHELRAALTDLLPDALIHRDTPGDVGTANKTAAELNRSDLAHVVIAAGKRLGEALRSIEEYAKTIDPAAAEAVERLRYRFYHLEREITLSFGSTSRRFDDVRLYVLVTESICRGDWLAAAEQAIFGGADCIQLREKDLPSGELLTRAKKLVDMCRIYDVPCIINDRPDIAVLADADGVHVGQEDLPVREARRIVGARRLVGVSTHHLDHARQAVIDGADYLGVGPFFRSSTKPRDFIAGPEYATQVAAHIRLPAVAIAGITADNVDQVLATGIKAIAVSSAVLSADDVTAAARLLKSRLPPAAKRSGGQAFLPVTRAQEPRPNAERPGGQAFLPVTRAQEPRPNPERPGGQAFLPVTRAQEPHPNPERPRGQAFLPVSRTPKPSPTPELLNAVPPTSRSPSTPPSRPTPPARQTSRRHLPHIFVPGCTYYLTFRFKLGEMSPIERTLVLDHIKAGDKKFYALHAAVIMPDHVHLLLTPRQGYTISRIMQGTKGVTAHLLNRRRNRSGAAWQDETFDRIIRDKNDYAERARYMLDNPVRKGIVADGWDYEWWYSESMK